MVGNTSIDLGARRVIALGLVAVALAGANAARAQDSAATHRSRFSTVIGTVIDSLHVGPLVNADVAVDGTNRSARTDSSGKFRIDSVAPGAIRLGVFHPLLDSIGVGLSSPPLIARSGDSLVITLATPSTAAVATRACQSVPAPVEATGSQQAAGRGVVVGRILDADSDEPVKNVEVTFTWTEYAASRATGFHRLRHVRVATTAPSGIFSLCHLPLGVEGALQAERRDGGAAAAASSVGRDLTPQTLLSLVTMHVPPLVTPTIAALAANATDATTASANAPEPSSSGASSSGATSGPPAPTAPSSTAGPPVPAVTTATGTNAPGTTGHTVTGAVPAATNRRYATGVAVLNGEVLNLQSKPVVHATVYIKGAADSATTDDRGSFTLHHLPSGTRSVVVRAVGFEPVIQTVELTSREPVNVVVPFSAPAIASLAPVVVTGRLDAGLKKVGFDARQRAGMGTFWTLPDIEKQKAYEFHDLLASAPGLKVDYNEQGQASLMATRGQYACIGYNNTGQATVGANCGPCVAYVIDGHPYVESEEGELDTYVHPDDVGAIEVYQDNEVPRSLAGTQADCINIVIWTKSRLGV
jgi:hypothetical protein